MQEEFGEDENFAAFREKAHKFYMATYIENWRNKLQEFKDYEKRCQDMAYYGKTYKQFIQSRKLVFIWLLICPDLIADIN